MFVPPFYIQRAGIARDILVGIIEDNIVYSDFGHENTKKLIMQAVLQAHHATIAIYWAPDCAHGRSTC